MFVFSFYSGLCRENKKEPHDSYTEYDNLSESSRETALDGLAVNGGRTPASSEQQEDRLSQYNF